MNIAIIGVMPAAIVAVYVDLLRPRDPDGLAEELLRRFYSSVS
ncbi:MAG TPA: hypothetical protein VJ738_02240 [Steroidobacteraceae bacterium]|nr:hypothetical protein [Steroidobacteraceae bacterium]